MNRACKSLAVTFRARASVREIAKVYGLTDEEIGRVTKRMPWFTGDVIETTRTHPVFKDISFPPPWPEILALARKIDGYPRGMSVHCGGVVIVPGAIDAYVPVQPSAKGVDVVQWEKDQSEEAGLVKIDLLGDCSPRTSTGSSTGGCTKGSVAALDLVRKSRYIFLHETID